MFSFFLYIFLKFLVSRAGNIGQLIDYLLIMCKVLNLSSESHKLGMVVHEYSLRTHEVEERGPGIQSPLQLHRKLKASLDK